MANVSTGIHMDSSLLNLNRINLNTIRPEVRGLMIAGEEPVQAYQTVRDQVIFTNRRVFVVNVQGITGKKVSYFSYPYSKVQYYGIETAGVLDVDSELIMTFANGTTLQFDFKANVDIQQLSTLISNYIL